MGLTILAISNGKAGQYDTPTDPKQLADQLANELYALVGGTDTGSIGIIPAASSQTGVASGTLTIAAAVDADACAVGGVTFTAKDAASTGVQFTIGGIHASGTAQILAGLVADDKVTIRTHDFVAKASGATGDQFNIGTTATDTAVNLAYAINHSGTSGITGVLTATSVNDTVTILAVKAGTAPNSYGLTQTGGHITVSAATLLGGTVDNTTSAVNLAAKINANATCANLVSATSALGVVTVSCVVPGAIGNLIPLTSAAGTITVNGAGTLTGGTGLGTPTIYKYGS